MSARFSIVLLSALAILPSSLDAATPDDIEVFSIAASHTELAPGTRLVLSAVVRATTSTAAPFVVRAYYDDEPTGGGRAENRVQLLASEPVMRGLAKGQSLSVELPITIPPCDRCGRRTVYVTTDRGEGAPRSFRTGTRYLMLDVGYERLPDLRVTSVAIDHDRGSTSDTVHVRGTVMNDSLTFAEGPFRVSAYCSSDPILTPKDRKLYSFYVPSLASGASVTLDRAVQLQPGCGVHGASTWIGVLADDQGTLPERDEENDGGSLPFWVLRAPDLSADALSLSATAGPPGSRVFVSYRIENIGGSAAQSFAVGVYLTRPGASPRSGVRLDAADVASLSAVTQSGLMQHLVTIPKVPRGRYELGVWADVDAANGELRRLNNFKAIAFDVTDQNLTDGYFRAGKKAAAPGDAIALSMTVRNTGRDAVPATKVGLYYSDDPRFERGADHQVGELAVPRLASGSTSKEQSVRVEIPPGAQHGYRYLIAVVDDAGAVSETDELDNVALAPILVASAGASAKK